MKGMNGKYKKTLHTMTLEVREPEFTPDKVASSSRAARDIAKAIYATLEPDQEHFSVLFLNSQNKVVGYKVLFTGGLDASIVDAQVVFRNAVVYGSAAMICVHNHPSGSITPSPEDESITQKLVIAGAFVGVKVLDHIIMGDGEPDMYFSFADKGLIKKYIRRAEEIESY
jgi:DNA repair protein RadC